MAAPDDNAKTNLLSSFTSVTGVTDNERVRFFLEAAAWNLDLAVESFFQEVDAEDDMPLDSSVRAPHQPPRDPTPPPVVREASHRHAKPAKSGPALGQESRIYTLGSLAAESCSSDSEEEGEAYYAGGSERGAGQQIIGPPKKKGDSGNFVSDMFKAAKERGAEVVEPVPSGSASGSSQAAFHGTAYRLGDSSAPSEMISSASASGGAAAASREVQRVLHLWRNGFSVDNGPLREYQAPENQQFLSDVKKGQIPQELIKESRGSEISINMTDQRNEDYVKPKTVLQSFAGEGHRLGSPTDVNLTPAAAPTADRAASLLADAAAAVLVDTQRPTTSVQIRLTDGTRLVSKFNTSHTVADIRRYITVARPEYAAMNFTLMTTFPNKDLVDETQDLTTAGLLNAVLVLKLNK